MPAKPPSPPLPSLSDAADTADVLNQAGLSTFVEPTGPVPGGAPAPAADINAADYHSAADNTPDAVQLIDPRSGAPVPLPPEQAEAAFKSGQLNIRDGETLHVKMPDGTIAPAAPSKLGQLLDGGAKLASPAEARQAELEGRYGSTAGAIAAGLAGVARTATFGASDWVAGQDKASREVLDYLKNEHGITSGLGEVGGLLLGGLGSAAEKGAKGLLGEGLGARIATHAARGLVEGAQLGHTAAISEDALSGGDHQLTAEKYFASLGENALYGGLLGGAGGLLGEAAGAAKSTLGKRLASMLGRTPSAENVEKVAEKTFGFVPDGLGRAFVKASSVASGESEEAITDALKARHIDEEALRTTATRDLTSHVNTLIKDVGDLQEDEMKGAGKLGHLRETVSKLDPPVIAMHSANTMASAQDVIRGMLDDPETYGQTKTLSKVSREFEKIGKEIVDAGERGDTATQFAKIDEAKRALGGWTRDVAGTSGRRSADAVDLRQARASTDKLKQLDESFRTNLEDPSVWGRAGVDQAKLNAAWTEKIAAEQQFNTRLATVTGRTAFGEKEIREADPAKIASYIGSLTNPNQDLIHRAITEYVQKTAALTKTLGERYDLEGESAAKLARASKAAESFEATLKDVGPKLAQANQLKAMLGREGSGMGPAAALGYVGHLVGGAPGAAVGGLVSTLASPARNAMRLAQLERLMGSFDGKIGASVGRFFARSEPAAERGIARESLGARVAKANRARKEVSEAEQTTRARFLERTEQVRKLESDPSQLAARVADHTHPIAQFAPKTASGLGAIAAKAAGFLSSKMPTAPSDALTGKKGIPSDGEMQRYMRYSDTVDHPEHVAEDLAKGRATIEQVDTLKAVYPNIYAELRGQVQTKLLDHNEAGKPFTYQQRLQMGLLFDVDSDPSSTPAAVNHAQATFAMPPQKPQGGGNVQAGGAHSALATAIKTPADAMSTGA